MTALELAVVEDLLAEADDNLDTFTYRDSDDYLGKIDDLRAAVSALSRACAGLMELATA